MPGWRGIAWAPVAAVLVKRRFWVVEAVPRDPDYLFGRIELWIDAESWSGAWSRKFSWKGDIAATYQIVGGIDYPAVGADGRVVWTTATLAAWQCMEAVPFNRATIAGLRADPSMAIEFGVLNPPSLFEIQALTRLGR